MNSDWPVTQFWPRKWHGQKATEVFWGKSTLFFKREISKVVGYFFQSSEFFELQHVMWNCCSHFVTMRGRCKDKSQQLTMVKQKDGNKLGSLICNKPTLKHHS